MTISPAEITTLLKKEIAGFDSGVEVESVGTVLQVGDGVARIYGLKDCMSSEMLEFPNGVFGIALNLEEDNVGAVVLGDDTLVKEGDTVKTTGRIISVPVGEALVGRVVNAIGQPIDGKPDFGTEVQYAPIEAPAPNVVQRQPEQFQPLAWRKLLLVAIFSDRHALDQFHHKVGPTGVSRTGVEHLGDIRMVHHRQCLPLGLEPGNHLPGIHSRLDDLQRYLARNRLGLLGHVDDAHTPFADLLKEPVGANLRTRLL